MTEFSWTHCVSTFPVLALLNYLFAAPAVANLLFGDASADREFIWVLGSLNTVWAGGVSFFASTPVLQFFAIDSLPFFLSGFYLSHYLRTPLLLIIVTCFLPLIFSERNCNLVQTMLFSIAFFVISIVAHAQHGEDTPFYAMEWNMWQGLCFAIVQALLAFYSHHMVLCPANTNTENSTLAAFTHAAAVLFAVTCWSQIGLPSSLLYDSNPYFLLPALLAIWNLLSFSYVSKTNSEAAQPLENLLLSSTSATAAGALLPSCAGWELLVVPVLWFTLTKSYLDKQTKS
jgi:hypothetical protein